MAKPCQQPLTEPPFTTYRDPDTGRWIVQKQQITPLNEYFKTNKDYYFQLKIA